MTKEDINNKLLAILKEKVSLMSYNTIFKDLQIHDFNNNEFILTVKSDNEQLLQTVEKNYYQTIEDILNDLMNDSCELKFVQYSKLDQIEKNKQTIEKIENNDLSNNLELDITNYKYYSNFKQEYTFDTFVVGESNKLAYGAALSVAKNPGKLYNPYFIYAKSGLGKTHLLHAIGNYIVNNSDKKVLYITAEQFINDYRSIVNAKDKYNNNVTYLEAFREKYRTVDVLIIDDIQFLEHYPKTQVEFANTFNSLHDNDKQIIIASDTSIDDYKYLEDRLKTRFKWGLTESINLPEVELKKNIIRNKLMLFDFDFDLSEDIIDYIANTCGSDIRNLENSLTRLHAYKAIFHINNYTLENAMDALREYGEQTSYKTNSIAKILNVVAKYYEIEVSTIKGKMKKKNIAEARGIAMYLSRMMTDESLERIGLEIGGRDHATVIHHYDKISKELKTNIKLQEEIKILQEKLRE